MSNVGKRPPGKDLKERSTVRLCDLQSERGKRLNESVAIITAGHFEGRHTVTLQDDSNSTMKVKTMNLRLVCSSCHGDQARFQFCSRCGVAAYCNTACQREHWKNGGHKVSCKQKEDQDVEEWKPSQDHPSWKKLTQPQRHALRKHHSSFGCTVPWPVSCETPAMLDPPAPCFLINHPNMQFKVNLQPLPGGFIMTYKDETRQVHGKAAPLGRNMPILRENVVNRFGLGSPKEYCEQVPPHSPSIVIYAVIGEVVWTQMCMLALQDYYSSTETKGAMFRWPGAECVGVCPGTGETVPFSYTDRHLLVASPLQGNAVRGTRVHALTRIMPRILTLKGYEKMMGPPGENRKITVGGERIEFYPAGLHKWNGGKSVVTAAQAFDEFHSSGYYKAFQRLYDDEKLEMMRAFGIETAFQPVGIGPSIYANK